MNRPAKHHYLPCFYLARWAAPDTQQLVEFSRPFGSQVKPRRTHPSGTGYVNRLYELRGLPAQDAQQAEELFFKPVDSLASVVLRKMETPEPLIPIEPRLREAWARFMLSLAMRTPGDIARIKEAYRAEWAYELREFTAIDTEKEAPAQSLYETVMSSHPHWFDNNALDLLTSLMDHRGLVPLIRDMHWFVVSTEAELPIFTCDRPVIMTPTLIENDAFIIIPIGPNRLFCATKAEDTMKRLMLQGTRAFAKKVNKTIVQRCDKLVLARSDKALGFVQKHFAKTPQPSLIERLIQRRSSLHHPQVMVE